MINVEAHRHAAHCRVTSITTILLEPSVIPCVQVLATAVGGDTYQSSVYVACKKYIHRLSTAVGARSAGMGANSTRVHDRRKGR